MSQVFMSSMSQTYICGTEESRDVAKETNVM